MAIIDEKEDDNHHQQLQQPSSLQSASNRKHLPTEIIVEVLLKLPVESLLRCKSVCKLWFSLVSDPRFVKSHLKLSAHNTRLIFRLSRSSVLSTCCLNDVMNGNIINNNGLEVVDCPLKSACREVRLVGSCNGLLCLSVRPAKDPHDTILLIWNPSIKKYHKLPSGGHRPLGFRIPYGFGYDETTDDYKVVSIFEETVKMYSLRNGGWKDIGAFPYGDPVGFIIGTFLNGALHWADCDGHRSYIVFLDLATETYGEVMMPPVYDDGKKSLTLGTLGEWLCVLCDYRKVRVDFWAMKVYGVKDSWTKLVCVPYTIVPDFHYPFLDPLCISNDGKIFFIYANKLMMYDANIRSFSNVQNFDACVEASTFFESLVSPLPPATALKHRVAGFSG